VPLLAPLEPAHQEVTAKARARRRRPLSKFALALAAVGVVLVSALAGLLVVASASDVYGARAELRYDNSQTSSAAIQQRMRTVALLVGSRAVLGEVAEDNGLTTDELGDATIVSVVDQSEVVEIVVERPTSEEAVRLAQGIADEGLTRLMAPATDNRSAIIEERLAELQAQADELSAAIQTGETAADAQIRYDRLLARISELELRLLDIRADAAEVGEPTLLTPAYALGSQSPNPLKGLAAGILMGLLVAAMMVAAVWQLRLRGAPH
jgi:hypothetical protein